LKPSVLGDDEEDEEEEAWCGEREKVVPIPKSTSGGMFVVNE